MKVPWTAKVIVLVVAAGAIAACDASAPTNPPFASDAPSSIRDAPSEPTPVATPMANVATPGTPIQQPSTAPAPEPLVLGGTWVEPKAAGRVTSYATTLSARPTAIGDGVTTFTKVVFSAAWDGAEKKVICRATEPGKDGVWGCKANLLAKGVPPGEVTFTFDVVGVGVPVAVSPDGSRRVTYVVQPPRPSRDASAAARAARLRDRGQQRDPSPRAVVRA